MNHRYRLLSLIIGLLCILPFPVSGQILGQAVYVARYKGDRVCAISYTFDDGLEDHYTVLFPQLKKYGIKATFWIWGKGIEHPEFQFGKPRMTWAQMQEMNADGQEISSHTWSHPNNMPKLTDGQIREELFRNDTAIFHHIGVYPRTLAYPANNMNERVVRIASEKRIATRITQFSLGEDVSHITPEKLRVWLSSLIKEKAWGVTMTHGIVKGYDYFHDPSILWTHFKEVVSMHDSVWIATFRDVAAYIKERDNMKLDIKKTKSGYRIKPLLLLDKELFNEPLTMVVCIRKPSFVEVRQNGRLLRLIRKKNRIVFDFDPHGGLISVQGK